MRVVTVGGASVERVLVVEPRAYRPGGKHTLEPSPVLAGGSAVNQACRLLAAGIDALPIAPICDDLGGQVVLHALAAAAARGGSNAPSPDEVLLRGRGIATPHTTITSVGSERTVFTEFSPGLFEPFAAHLESGLRRLEGRAVDAVMVGHLHADRADPPGRGGALTERVVSEFRRRGVPVFANPGSSQYLQGIARWQHLLPELAAFQLDIDELRTFVEGGDNGPSLERMLDRFRDHCTVIVTLERLGAVARRRGSSRVVLAWPYDIETVDTTGAGDAFGAGVVSALAGSPLRDDDALVAAMDHGALFAAHACTTRGGADDCPTEAELEAFRGSSQRMLEVEVAPLDQERRLLTLLDRAFPPRR